MKPADVERVSKAATLVVGGGDKSVSSAQLKHVETSGSGGFGVKISDFSVFWWFSMELTDSELVSRAVTMLIGAGDTVGGCDSKTARNGALFSCLVGYGVIGVGDELSVVGDVRG